MGFSCSKSDKATIRPMAKRQSKLSDNPMENDRDINITNESNKNSDISDLYELLQPISKGKFGLVKLAQNKLTKKKVAIKMLSRKKEKKFIEELKILKILDHPNIIKINEVFQDKSFIYVVMDYCIGGEIISQSNREYSENYIALVVFKLLHALNHMNLVGIVHRDLKPENCLIDGEGDIKIIDFGFATFINPFLKIRGVVGTPYYMAPEVLSGVYGPECDVWSIGIIMHILIMGYPPFTGKTNLEIIEKIKKDKVVIGTKEINKVSPKARELLRNLLCKDPKKRISASEAIKNPWFDLIKTNVHIPSNVYELLYKR